MSNVDKFAQYLTADLMRSPLTVRAYVDDLHAFEKYMDGDDVEMAVYSDVRSYVMLMVERGDSLKSVNRRISSLRTFFDFLILNDVVSCNPCAKIRALKTEKRLPHFVDRATIERLVDAEVEDDVFANYLIVKLLYYTGIRRAELVSLDVESIDFSQRMIRFKGKGSKWRVVPLVDSLVVDLERYLGLRSEKICNSAQKALFLNGEGGRIGVSDVYRIVKAELEAYNVEGKRSPHILRHTFATHLTAAGVGVRSVQELLGHSSIAATQIYAHNTIEALKSSYNKAHPRASKNKKV